MTFGKFKQNCAVNRKFTQNCAVNRKSNSMCGTSSTICLALSSSVSSIYLSTKTLKFDLLTQNLMHSSQCLCKSGENVYNTYRDNALTSHKSAILSTFYPKCEMFNHLCPAMHHRCKFGIKYCSKCHVNNVSGCIHGSGLPISSHDQIP